MKFLLDENFPKTAENLLAEFDHQIIDIRGTEQQGMEDENLFELAQREQAVLLTTDRDFYHTIPFSYDKHFGVIVIALKQPNRAAILNRLRWFISQDLLANIDNTVSILRDHSYRVRRN
jgi:predicted nuclease of predicted toxin-antitoxin system